METKRINSSLCEDIHTNSPPLVGGDRGGGNCKAKRAFSTLEYSLLIAVAIAALITMSVYIKRAVSGRFKDTADSFGFGRQYEPDVTKCYDASGSEIPC